MTAERTHTLAWGVRTSKEPRDMTRNELEDALYDVAEFASRALQEARTLRRLVTDQLERGTDAR